MGGGGGGGGCETPQEFWIDPSEIDSVILCRLKTNYKYRQHQHGLPVGAPVKGQLIIFDPKGTVLDPKKGIKCVVSPGWYFE